MTPPAPEIALPSKGQINRCGNFLKDAWHDPTTTVTEEELEAAIAVVADFRAAHAYPMLKVRYGLRSFVRSEGAAEAVSQRLKRVPRIVRKLHRMGNSSLARLEDIGGCRAVLTDGPELERVRRRLVRTWGKDFTRPPRDYIESPKDIGYRAVHFVVKRDGRAIEVQLRTRGQQQWANAIEEADNRIPGSMLKDGQGPAELVAYFSAAAEVIYLREYGREAPADLMDRFNEARRSVIAARYYSE